MGDFNPTFKRVGSLRKAARAINAPHDEDLSCMTEYVIDSYIFLFSRVRANDEFRAQDTRRIHSIISPRLLHDVRQIGRYRTIEVTVGGNKTCDPLKIMEKMEELFPIQRGLQGAQDFYREFQLIHPFADGNGRVGGIMFTVQAYRDTKEWWAPCQ